MESHKVSDTYKLLYHDVIEELFYQVCLQFPNYCVKWQMGNKLVPYAIYDVYMEYRGRALQHMSSQRLDRHKLASCICGALLETAPITTTDRNPPDTLVNEAVALHTGLNVIKYYMMEDIMQELKGSDTEKAKVHQHLQEHFIMQFPAPIRDSQEYERNLLNAFHWCHSQCRTLKRDCFSYDIWAYSKIFYHLELFNQDKIRKSCEEYFTLLKKQEP